MPVRSPGGWGRGHPKPANHPWLAALSFVIVALMRRAGLGVLRLVLTPRWSAAPFDRSHPGGPTYQVENRFGRLTNVDPMVGFILALVVGYFAGRTTHLLRR